MTDLHLDWETRSDINLKKRGLDVYAAHPSTRPLMLAWAYDDDEPELWLPEHGPLPQHIIEAMSDPTVHKWAFNARFERMVYQIVMARHTPIKGWRCAQALSYMHGFYGGLDDVGEQMMIDFDKQKFNDGLKLVRKFTQPQKITKNQPHLWRDETTDPEDWERFCLYCRQDVVAERAIKKRLLRFPIPQFEWQLYELDQKINDRGIPIDLEFVRNAIELSDRRKAELFEQMQKLTGLANPNSVSQLLKFLQDNGYPWGDLQKFTVAKALVEHEEGIHELMPVVQEALLLRQQSARMAVAKYDAMLEAVSADGRVRGAFQFGGASRTNRWAGRKVQTQNMVRTPADMEKNEWLLDRMTEAVRRGDYDELAITYGEPMDVLAGLVRSAIAAEPGKELRVGDLRAIETCAAAWEANCTPLLDILNRDTDNDPYKHLAMKIYNVAYEEVTSAQRQVGKPGILGGIYSLSGGDLRDGKRTGMWGYAENMGVKIPQKLAHDIVKALRELCPQIASIWREYENAFRAVLIHGRPIKIGPVTFEQRKPYLCIVLPSGRRIFYYLPQVKPIKVKSIDQWGKEREWTKYELSYMGKEQNTSHWGRIITHGGKILENITQAISRDALAVGMVAADEEGFDIIGHAHDEIITEKEIGDNYYTWHRLCEIMSRAIDWAKGLPLSANGYAAPYYRKA